VEFIRSFREILIDKNWLLGKIRIGKKGVRCQEKKIPIEGICSSTQLDLAPGTVDLPFRGKKESPDAKEKVTEIV